jgi:phosphate-selective porin OprO/OprP
MRVNLDPVVSAGASVELSWLVTGERRRWGHWVQALRPLAPPVWGYGAWEVAVRAERIALGRVAHDVTAGGAYAGAAAVHWWANDVVALSVAGYVQQYDVAPIEEPGTTLSWTLLLRATAQAP